MRIFRTIQIIALAAMSVAGAQEPGARQLASQGRAALEAGDFALAAQSWTRYRELMPQDRNATEQLVQAYQGLNKPVERDRERERLIAIRQAMAEGLRKSYSVYVRDRFTAGGRKFAVMEYFEPRGPMFIDYAFDSYDADFAALTRYSVGSYVATVDTATETGAVRKGERVYYIDRYEAQQSSTYRIMKEQPSYEAMKSMVIAAVEAASARPVLTREGAGPSGGLTEVILERTWCYGTCPIDELVLRADGTALYTGKQNTPMNGLFSGSFPKEEFDRLTRWLVAEGFLEMKGIYGSPNADTPTQVIRVARGADSKSVINNSIDRSEVLAGMESVIRGAAAEIHWQPVRSGIRATANWKITGEDWRPMQDTPILVYPPGGKQEFTLRTDAQGRFEISLPPGTYRIEPLGLGRSYLQAKPPVLSPYLITVVVQPDKYFEADFRFDREAGGASITARSRN